jgi:hypothetical protein
VGDADVLTSKARLSDHLVSWSLVSVLCLLMLSPFERVSAVPSTQTGSVGMSFSSSAGDSNYTVLYSFPGTAVAGKSLNVTLTLEVNELTNLKLYVVAYEMDVTLYLTNGNAIIGKIMGPTGNPNSYLYAGSHWGPVNVTIPVTDAAAGISSGASMTGYLSVTLISDVWYDLQAPNLPVSYPESDSKTMASITVVPEGSASIVPTAYLEYASVAAVAALAAGGFWVLKKRRAARANAPG